MQGASVEEITGLGAYITRNKKKTFAEGFLGQFQITCGAEYVQHKIHNWSTKKTLVITNLVTY